jgi:hypothetical protein
MRRLALLTVLASLLLAPAAAAASAEWHSEQPIAPGIGVASPLGKGIGDIEFWAPNRGVLISPAGIYAYDGTGWHLYSTVCGGHEGRIAWAGPDDFWTISDQQLGQELTEGSPERTQRISLCHFDNGEVVASYGQPVGARTSYLPMMAAACSGPDDCWFAGKRLPGSLNVGAFHLHWNGVALTATPSLTTFEPELGDPGRTIEGLAYWGGRLYESARVEEGDEAPGEPADDPALLHLIEPGTAQPFRAVPSEPLSFTDPDATAAELGALHLSADGVRLWGAAGAATGSTANPVVVQLTGNGLRQLPLEDPGEVLGQGVGIAGLAAEPGSNSAWLSISRSGGPVAEVVRVRANGAVEPAVQLPGSGEGISPQGEAGPIVCPAAEQCWMVTRKGWLFHLGGDLPQDTDPAMHAVIGFRPADESVPLPPPADIPDDDSGAEKAQEEASLPNVKFHEAPAKKKLVVGLQQRIIHKRILQLTFKLEAPATVRLVAKLRKKVIAATPRRTLGVGHHRLRLRLDPKHWPDDLKFEVHAKTGKKAG